MEELKWPVDVCESCGYNLREAAPKAAEKTNDANGRLKWTDFCPKCGRGMFVGDRVLPKPPEDVDADVKSILSYEKDKGLEAKPEGKPSGVPPDKRGADLAAKEENPDPEGLLGKKLEVATPEAKAEPGAIRPPGKGEYFCTKCVSNHKDTDKPKSIGLRHKKYREA